MIEHPLDLDAVQAFVHIAELGSFTRAADNTGHSTSYISKEINKLEQRLGVRLMNRTTRTQHLTGEGELFYQQCQQIIADACEVQNALSGQQQQPSGHLRGKSLSTWQSWSSLIGGSNL